MGRRRPKLNLAVIGVLLMAASLFLPLWHERMGGPGFDPTWVEAWLNYFSDPLNAGRSTHLLCQVLGVFLVVGMARLAQRRGTGACLLASAWLVVWFFIVNWVANIPFDGREHAKSFIPWGWASAVLGAALYLVSALATEWERTRRFPWRLGLLALAAAVPLVWFGSLAWSFITFYDWRWGVPIPSLVLAGAAATLGLVLALFGPRPDPKPLDPATFD
jgi:hypothetical protein